MPAVKAPEGGLPEILHMLARHKFTLLGAALLGLLLGGASSLLMQPRYQARVAMQIQNPNADFLGARSVNSVADVSAADSGNLTDIATEIKIMESDQLLDRVIATLRRSGKATSLETSAQHLSLLARVMHRVPAEGDGFAYRLRELARPNLSVKQVGPTRAVEVVYTASDPVFAAQFANTFAAEYMEMSDEFRKARSLHTEFSLSKQLDEVRVRLKASQDALQRYAESSGLLFVSGLHSAAELGDISESKLVQLQGALSQAHADRVQAQSHYDVARTANPDSVGDVLNDPRLRELNEKLADLKRQRADLATTYTEENDKVRRVVAQIEPLQSEFNHQRQSVLSHIEEDYNMAKRREALLKSSYNAQVYVVEGKEGQGIQYSVLKQEVDSNQKLYESVLEQVKRVGISSAVRSDNVEIYDVARPPATPTSPRPLLLAAAGMISGFLVTALILIFTDKSGSTLYEPGQLTGSLHLRELGVIPGSRTPRLLGRGGKESGRIEISTWSKTNQGADEAYRGLLTSILYANADGCPAPKTIVITSVNEGEGKTTTLCNLGVAMAELNQRVLLVDADLRRPRLHQVFGVPGRRGLSDLLHAGVHAEAVDLVQTTFVPNLSILPAGSANQNPAALFHSGGLDTLLALLGEHFDVILVDSAPCLLTVDARILSRHTDAVMLIVRAGYTTWDEVETAARIFVADGARVLGAVLNDVRPRKPYYNAKDAAA